MSITTNMIVLVLVVGALQAATLKYRPEYYRIPPSNATGPSHHHHNHRPDQSPDEKTYLFAADGKKRPYAFVNEMGTLVGFDVDLIEDVCSLVGKKCKMILAPYQECVFTYKDIDYAGTGLSAQYFDGCPGYTITSDRENEFDFTLPYLATSASFTVAPGNPSGFDPDDKDFSKYKLLRLSGAPTNGPCLTRLDKQYKTILIAQNLPEAKEALLNGTADVLFSPRTKIPDLETFPVRVHCDEGGAGIMLRIGSDLASWWNPAFQTYYFSGKYEKLCEASMKKYGGQAKCLPSPNQASTELMKMMSKTQEVDQPEERLWKFVVSGKIAPFSYMNPQGNLVGWTKDFVMEVCRRAGKRCVLMLAKVSECTTRDGEFLYPGRGLMDGWFDACTGYFETFDRDNSWDFTAPYLISNASFYVRHGNPEKFDPLSNDYSKFKIVHTDTSITNDHCLNRLHKKFATLMDVPTRVEAIQAVLNGTADAWFTKRLGETDLEELPQKFHCENVGTSIMSKKGSGLPEWWNPAFQEFYTTGEFNQFCKDKGSEYNYDFPCVPPPTRSQPARWLEGLK